MGDWAFCALYGVQNPTFHRARSENARGSGVLPQGGFQLMRGREILTAIRTARAVVTHSGRRIAGE
jgi:hypothetical protein